MRIENRKHLYLKQKILSFFIIILFILPLANAIKITPYIDAGQLEYNKSYAYSIYIENDEDAAKSIVMKITPRASYLADYVRINPTTFLLGKGSSRNVFVELSIPNSMPGEHQLTIMPETSEASGGVTIVSAFVATIRFSLPGNVVKSLIAEDFTIAIDKNTATFAIKGKNNGNVRVSAFPVVEIWRGDSFLARIEGNTEYLTYAGAAKNMELKHIAGSNAKYRAIAFVKYDGTMSNKIEKEFEITSLPQQQQSSGSSDNTAGSAFSGPNLNTSLPKNVPTVNIGGNNTDKDNKALRILKFSAEQAKPGEPFVMLLSLENLQNNKINYEYIFEITENGILVYTQTGSDTINDFETKEIKHSWLPAREGNYKIRAAIFYNGQLLEEYSNINARGFTAETPTGLVTSNQSSALFMIILLIVPIVFIILWKKRVKQ